MSDPVNVGRRQAARPTAAVKFGPGDQAQVQNAIRNDQGVRWSPVDEMGSGVSKAVVDLSGERTVHVHIQSEEGKFGPEYVAQVVTEDGKPAPGIPEFSVQLPSKGDGPAVSVPGEPNWW